MTILIKLYTYTYLPVGGVAASILIGICLLWIGVVNGVGFHPGGSALNMPGLYATIGIYAFAFSGHSVFPNVYTSMKHPSRFPFVLVVRLCCLRHSLSFIYYYHSFSYHNISWFVEYLDIQLFLEIYWHFFFLSFICFFWICNLYFVTLCKTSELVRASLMVYALTILRIC